MELEQEVKAREADLFTYRQQLAEVNKQLESLIGKVSFEIKTALAIQKLLVPTEMPNISGIEFSYKFVPSMVRGGDYFDIFEHEDKFRFGLIVESSSGHGMSSLLLSVLLKLSAQMEARKGGQPHEIVNFIYNELHVNLANNESADLFYAVIDRRSFEMKFCALGVCSAYYQDFETGEIKVLKRESTPLSLEFKTLDASSKLVLNPRDRIIIATRGIAEAQNISGEFFGEERLINAIHAAPRRGVHELRNDVLIKLNKFTSGCEVQRDQTLLVAEVKDRVIKLA